MAAVAIKLPSEEPMKTASIATVRALLAATTLLSITGCALSPILDNNDIANTTSRALAPMQAYFGNLHSHTQYSDGKGTPYQTLSWARDTVKYDFYAITDHAEQLSSSEWNDIGTQVNAFTNNSFVAIRGFEYSNPFGGHINVFNTSSYKSYFGALTISSIYKWIDGQNAVAQWNHPGDTAMPGDFSGFKWYSNVVDNMALLETGNGNDGNISGKYQKWFITALDKGWKAAPTNNMDNHSMSTNGHRTVILAPSLTRDNLLSAMRARRVYASDDTNMKVSFSANGAWMGSDIKALGNVTLEVSVQDDEMIQKMEIVSNGGQVVASSNFNTSTVTWNPTVNVSGKQYFFLRVYETNTQEPGEPVQLSLTAPLFFNY
jgi:hypothetical protein